MQQIWKWEISPDCELEMPEGAKILTVQEQHSKPMLWALVYPVMKTEIRKFNTYGTGHPIAEEPGKYIGTFQLDKGNLVFHVFEELKI